MVMVIALDNPRREAMKSLPVGPWNAEGKRRAKGNAGKISWQLNFPAKKKNSSTKSER